MTTKTYGRSQSIYFNATQAGQLDDEAFELGIDTAVLIKAKALSKSDKVKVIKQVNLGHDVNLSLVNIADSFFEISRVFDGVVANDDIDTEDLRHIREKHDEVMGKFSSALTDMQKAIAKSNRAG